MAAKKMLVKEELVNVTGKGLTGNFSLRMKFVCSLKLYATLLVICFLLY